MNPQHKLSKVLARQRRIARRTIHKDLGNKLEPAEATYHATPTLPKGNLSLVSHIKLSPPSSDVTRVLQAMLSPTLVVVQTS